MALDCIYMFWIMFFSVTSLTLGLSCDCPSVSKVTLKDMTKIDHFQNHNKITNCVHDSWDILCGINKFCFNIMEEIMFKCKHWLFSARL